MKTSRKSSVWKQAERETGSLLGGKRVPVTGRSRGDAPDVEHPILSIEQKHRATIPKWLEEAMEQADAANKNGDKTPIAVIHKKRQRYDESLVVIRIKDFIKLTGIKGTT